MRFIIATLFIIMSLSIVSRSAMGLSHETSIDVFHKKCMVELRYQFVPSNCFQWIKRISLNSHKKSFLKEWFNSVCKKAMKKDESQVQFHVQRINDLSGECRRDLEVAFEQWSYKSKIDDPEKVLQLLVHGNRNAGRDLEYRDHHDLEKTKRNRNLGSARRRLN